MSIHKIKICLVSISLGRGGLERSVGMLSEMLVEKGYDVHTVILNDEIYQSYKGEIVNLGKLKSGKDNLIRRFNRFQKLRKFLVKENFDLIIDHRSKSNYLRERFYSEYIYRGFRKIYVVHNYFLDRYLGKNLKLKNIYASNVANVCVSKEIENKITDETRLDNFTTIYNAFDSQWNKTSLIKVAKAPKNYILAMGRIDDTVKNFSFLIKTYRQSILPKKGIDLLILGSGKDVEKLKKIVVHLCLEKEVVFIPHTDNPFPYIHDAKFFCLTSKHEGFPMVLLESLALGTPVVSVNCKSGPDEIIQHEQNGLLVTEGNEWEFTQALNRMTEDQELYNRCKENANKSIVPFSKEKIAEKWHQLIQESLI